MHHDPRRDHVRPEISGSPRRKQPWPQRLPRPMSWRRVFTDCRQALSRRLSAPAETNSFSMACTSLRRQRPGPVRTCVGDSEAVGANWNSCFPIRSDELEAAFAQRLEWRCRCTVWTPLSTANSLQTQNGPCSMLAHHDIRRSHPARAHRCIPRAFERDQVFDEEDSVWWGWRMPLPNSVSSNLSQRCVVSGQRHLRPLFREGPRRKPSRTESAPQKVQQTLACLTKPIQHRSMTPWRRSPGLDIVKRRHWPGADRRDKDGFPDEDDPVEFRHLTEREQNWLAGFLVSSQAPSRTMTFEMLDGLLTALVIGPAIVPPSQYMPAIWGTDDGSGPVWDSLEQLQYFMELLMKHWNAIAARRNADALHDPFILGLDEATAGTYWAQGLAGVALAEAGGTDVQGQARRRTPHVDLRSR